jgi:hypothetical protein
MNAIASSTSERVRLLDAVLSIAPGQLVLGDVELVEVGHQGRDRGRDVLAAEVGDLRVVRVGGGVVEAEQLVTDLHVGRHVGRGLVQRVTLDRRGDGLADVGEALVDSGVVVGDLAPDGEAARGPAGGHGEASFLEKICEPVGSTGRCRSAYRPSRRLWSRTFPTWVARARTI